MPLALQPKLLRFLQEHEFMRLGGSEVLRSDVRIVAATNRDLQKMVQDGIFREDLLNRLEVFTIKVPSLREDPESATMVIESLPDWMRGPRPDNLPGPDQSPGVRKKITREDALEALNQTGGHHQKAARLLGISRAQLFRLKKKFAIS